MSDRSWMERGACRTTPGVDPAVFFPHEGDRRSVNTARKLCFRCDVRLQCLDFCLDNDEQGIWGGTTDYERRQMRVRRRRSA
jgi:WhiB family transcriptional regulator, redox-sensing transcriptional regulator